MKRILQLICVLTFCFICVTLSAQDQNNVILSDLLTPADQFRFEKAVEEHYKEIDQFLEVKKDKNLINNSSLEGDCWDEIEDLESIMYLYKKIHLDCYYDRNVDTGKLFRISRTIDNYSRSIEDWSGWCYGYSALLFVDLIAFLDKYNELTCLE